ncbi:MAG: ATP-binding protein [Armatimonadota bacterium]
MSSSQPVDNAPATKEHIAPAEQVAVLHHTGDILTTTQAWTQAAQADDTLLAGAQPGCNFSDTCRQTTCLPAKMLDEMIAGLHSVLSGAQSGYTLEYACPTPQQAHWFLLAITPLTGQGGAMVTHQEISALRAAREDAEETRQLLDALMAYIPTGVTIADAPGVRIRRVSRYGQELSGRSQQALEDTSADAPPDSWEVYHADGVNLATADELPLTRATVYGATIRDEEWVLRRPDGTQIPILCNAGPIRDADGRITGGIIAWSDITRLKRLEAQQAASLALLQTLLRASLCVMAEKTIHGLLKCVVAAACELTGAHLATSGHGYAQGAFLANATAYTDGVSANSPEELFQLACARIYPELQQTRKSLRVGRQELAQRADRRQLPPGLAALHGLLAVPLFDVAGQATGLILVAMKEERDFSAENEALLGQLATIASLGLQHIAARNEAEQRTKQVEMQAEELQLQAEELEVQQEELLAQTAELHEQNTALQTLTSALETERALLAAVLQQMPAGIVVVEAESENILLGNAQMEAIWRRPVLSVQTNVEYGAWPRFHPDGIPYAEGEWPLARSLATGEVVTDEEFLITRGDGTQGFIQVSSTPVRNAQGQIVAGVVISADITARKEAERLLAEERAHLAGVFEVLPIPLLVFSRGGEVLRQNSAATTFLAQHGFTRWQDITLCDPITHLPVPQHERPLSQAFAQGSIVSREGLLALPDGREMPVIAHAAPICVEGTVVAAISAYQDISDLKEADRAKNEFLAVLSHELLTPITSILGWSKIALQPPNPAAQQQALTVIRRNAKRQYRLVGELLDVSRIIHRKLIICPEPMDLRQAVEQCRESAQQYAHDRGITLVVSSARRPLLVMADGQRMQQVITNLLNNAIKFTEHGGTVTVTTRRQGRWAVLNVTDTGCGLPPEAIPTLFTPFRQIQRQESKGGLGLGLALVKGIVELHGGRISAISSGPGLGSTFTVNLPLANG